MTWALSVTKNTGINIANMPLIVTKWKGTVSASQLVGSGWNLVRL